MRSVTGILFSFDSMLSVKLRCDTNVATPLMVDGITEQSQSFDARCCQSEAGGRLNPVRTGGMAERFKAPVLKTGDPQGSVGSNPTPSAMLTNS